MIIKILCWAFTILQTLFLVTAYGIQFFSMKKMGMMRYVLFINHEWETRYPIAVLQYAAITFLVVLSIGIILYAKTREVNNFVSKKFLPMIIIQIVITLVFVFFTIAYSTESYRSYYFISLILAITALIQDIKILLCLKKPDHSLGFVF